MTGPLNGHPRSNVSSDADEHSTRDDGHMEDSRYHKGFLRRTTQLLSRYGIETHG
jgi:hypothetical protein